MILSALSDHYQRLLEREEVPPWGYSNEKISFSLRLSKEGEIVGIDDIRDTSKKQAVPKRVRVPLPPKRSGSKSPPCFLWDKTSFTLGVTAKTDKKSLERLPHEHERFKREVLRFSENSMDEGVRALRLFLEKWSPDKFETLPIFQSHKEEIKDSKVIFRLDGELGYIHDRPAAKKLVEKRLSLQEKDRGVCLVTNKKGDIARLHPSIKGVKGAQSSGASIVSFNIDAFESYKKKQGKNSPVSERVAFQYTTALNCLLRGDRRKVVIGDTTVVFWAKAQGEKSAEKEEETLASFFGCKSASSTDEQETKKIREVMEKVVKGRPLHEIDPDLDGETEFYILGLAPNASRLSIRYWEAGTFGAFFKRLSKHFQDLKIEPSAWSTPPSVYFLSGAIAPYRGDKQSFDEVPPNLAGEILRSILTGRRYPQNLLTNVLMRFRSDGKITPLRVALCKAVLTRNYKEEISMGLDKNCRDEAYLLGRLFGELENAQRVALGKDINATIKDRYYGAASATPAYVFPLLIRNCTHHLSKAKKEKSKKDAAYAIEGKIKEIFSLLENTEFPKSFGIKKQGIFVIGYYHQTNNFKKKTDDAQEGEDR